MVFYQLEVLIINYLGNYIHVETYYLLALTGRNLNKYYGKNKKCQLVYKYIFTEKYRN